MFQTKCIAINTARRTSAVSDLSPIDCCILRTLAKRLISRDIPFSRILESIGLNGEKWLDLN